MKLYSPNQAIFSFFIGGFLALAVMLYNNLSYFGKSWYYKYIIPIGVFVSLLSPVFMRSIGLYLAVASVVYVYASDKLIRQNVSKDELKSVKESWLRVIMNSIVCLITSIAFLAFVSFMLDKLNLLNIDEIEQIYIR